MKRRAVYAGTFDPPTLGHLDVVKRVQPLFDHIYLVVADNYRKSTMFSAQERVSLLQQAIADISCDKTIEVVSFSGLLVDFCKKNNVNVLLRGLRAMSDFENEFQMATMNRRLSPEVETLHIMTDERFYFVSSTIVKEVAHHGGNLQSLVPSNVITALKERVQKK